MVDSVERVDNELRDRYPESGAPGKEPTTAKKD